MNPQALQTASQFAIAVGILLTGVAGYGAYHYGRLAADLKDQAAATREDSLKADVGRFLASNESLQRRLEPFMQLARERHPSLVTDDALERLREDLEILKGEIKGISDAQTLEIMQAMRDMSRISERIDSLAHAIQERGSAPQLVSQLRLEARSLADASQQWVEQADRRQQTTRAQMQLDALSVEQRSIEYNNATRPYYTYFLESLKAHVNALKQRGFGTTTTNYMDLPATIVFAGEPIIRGDAHELLKIAFPSGRRWTVILTSGATSISEVHLPHLYIALAQPSDQDHGPNYLEVHMQQKSHQDLVFSVRSNYETIRQAVAKENGPLDEFQGHIDHMLEVLLEREQAQ